jgi:hypothetical protein
MTTMLRYHQRGRFGREVQGDDVQTAETRTAMTNDERTETAGYAIDPDAVAAAIVDRLFAGRTISAPPPS